MTAGSVTLLAHAAFGDQLEDAEDDEQAEEDAQDDAHGFR